MKRLLFPFISLSFACLLSQGNQKEDERLFSLNIHSQLEANCFACHSQKAGKVKGDLELTSRESMLFGGVTSDRVLIPGDPDKSLLMTAIEWKDEEYEMPPKENDRLSVQQIEWFRKWIELGAPWPNKCDKSPLTWHHAQPHLRLRSSRDPIPPDPSRKMFSSATIGKSNGGAQ